MPTTSTSKSQSSLLGAAPDDLFLRVRGGSREEPIIRLTSSKCTVGAADGCTLRLQSPGVKPVHCLILRGKTGTVVRRMSTDTRLNGRVFSDSPLYPGDRLGIGPLEFEILASPAERAATNQCQVPSGGDGKATTSVNSSHAANKQVSVERQKVHAELLHRIKSVRSHARSRISRLVQQIREMRYDLAALQSRAQSAEANAASSQQKVAELAALAQQLRAEIVKADEERRAQVGEIERLSTDAAQLRTELAEQRNLNAEQQARWNAERSRYAGQISELAARAEQSESSTASREEIDAMTADWQKEREAAEAELESLRQQIETISTELQQRTCDLENEQEARAAEQANLESAEKEEQGVLANEREQLERQRLELSEKVGQFDQQKQQWDVKQAELEEQLAAREQDLATQREEWEQENAERSAELARREEDLTTRQQQLDAQIEQQQTALEAVEQQLANAAPPVADATSPEDLSQERERLQAEWAQLGRELEQLEEERREWRQRRSDQEAAPTALVSELEVGETSEAADAPDEPKSEVAPSTEDSIFELVNQNLAAARSVSDATSEPREEAVVEVQTEAGSEAHRSSEETPQTDVDGQDDQPNLEETVQDVLARLGCGVDWEDGEDRPEEDSSGSADVGSIPSQPTAEVGGLTSSVDFDSPAEPRSEDVVSATQPQEPPVEMSVGFSGLTSPAKVTAGGFETAELQNDSPGSEDDGDDSINAYMENLMKRMRDGDGASGDEIDFAPKPTWQPPEEPHEEAEVEAKEEPAAFADPSEYKPAKTAPEKADSLAAMREIANSTARTAIHKHTHSRAGQVANGKLLIALVGVVCGAVLLFTSQGQGLKFLAGVVGLLVAALWGIQAMRLKRNAQFERQITTDQLAAPRVQSILDDEVNEEPAIV